MPTPLFNAVQHYISLERSRFHTPGHKGNFFSEIQFSHDVTELPETDSLFEAQGAIDDAEKLAQHLFGSDRTLFSAGGCTLCLQTMLRLACPNENDEIIMGRNIHRAAVNTCALLRLNPVWIYPDNTAGSGFPGRYSAEAVESALRNHPLAKAVYITTPDYYGCISPVKDISSVCRKYGVPLLVDRAHGTHLPFIEDTSPVISGADIYADSAHKTLPVLTGGAFLNIYNNKYSNGAKCAMRLFASTSPSYLIMESLDLAREWLSLSGKKAYQACAETGREIKETAISRGIGVPLGICDPCRITLRTADIGISGTQASDFFRRQGIEPEYSDSLSIVFILTPQNSREDTEVLKRAIRLLPAKGKKEFFSAVFSPAQTVISPSAAVLSSCEILPVNDSIGHIAAESACTCPPGIPIVIPGEMITEKIAAFLINYGILQINVVK